MDSFHAHTSPFQLEGQFLGFISKSDGHFKSIRLAIGERELQVKLDKGLRHSGTFGLAAGDWISISGQQQFNSSFTKLKLKAYQVNRLSCNLSCKTSETLTNSAPSSTVSGSGRKKGKILLCNKSDCANHGGKELHQILEKTLGQLGLSDHVTIEKTSCQKRCSKAPNLILMPGKARHSKPNPKSIDNLIRDHYCNDNSCSS
ncbi:(2Fe-2S) ferredoxin domain-containing protein [Aphanothece sacrum]|uniref:DNA-binding protein n=1 Tax=Aphanothece sacrum FPU1 TaxID=1920663 RepID=A0A401ICI8_APHSA|nr:(2Fe-2S) ferredoxin domain-containing protein [Aphanothece sacrum]GBF79013.1 DNA-binding protein [Aphanothece sacrum FPU1]GBF86108.1 DNA-binding protein [Aphanothece sacrum FPU3]